MDMTKIGFLSFGHWRDVPGSKVRSGREALVQAIDLAVAAEEAGVDGAYFRVHHFAPQQAAPFPLLSAIAAKTSRIEIGTGVIDMRYENPLYMAEEAAATDLISGGRLQLGVSRGSPETALAGYQQFGYVPDAADENGGDMARAHTNVFRRAIAGEPMANANPQMTGSVGSLPISPLSDSLATGSGGRRHPSDRGVDRRAGHEPDVLDPADRGHRCAVRPAAGRADRALPPGVVRVRLGPRTARLGLAQHHPDHRRRVAPLLRRPRAGRGAGPGRAPRRRLARFGRSYIGEPEQLVAELAADQAVRAADTVLVTVPNQLGVDFNARLLAAVKDVFTEVDAEPLPA